jgi:soluble lytic murein transglycosylase-like protein
MSRAARRHAVPLGVLYAVGLSETGRKGVLNPYALNVDGKTVLAADLRGAVAHFHDAKRNGAKLIDLGCMQINHRYHGDKFPHLEAMLDPVRNVDYAARFLKELRAREGNWTMAVARYNAGLHSNGVTATEGDR